MSVFDRFRAKRNVPTGYAEVKVEFTEEESEAISQTLARYAAVTNADAPEGMTLVVPQKVKVGIIAQDLTEYVKDLIGRLEDCESDIETASIMSKAIKAQMKAYASRVRHAEDYRDSETEGEVACLASLYSGSRQTN